MRFYVPEWDDHVDAAYDFVHDEHSNLSPADRDLTYIWDIFDRASTPIDGVLISREQVEDSPTKFDRITSHGVYDDPRLDLPEWLPTISDCGAWGYKQLPFPPYGNRDMLEFYETLDVDVGVTIDHLVLGSGHTSRLYLDDRAFGDEFTTGDLPDWLAESDTDVMTDTWPDEWPDYIAEYDSTLPDTNNSEVDIFRAADFEGKKQDVLTRLKDDPRAVYRDDDMAFRYELTLDNAAEMGELYRGRDYSFRLMAAVQGWDSDSYEASVEDVLDLGYQCLGIGGMAGSSEEDVKRVVSTVGNAVKHHERTYRTRVDTHVFGFAKTDAFDTIGRSGMASFDSASMLRAAWTGGENYHLDNTRRFDAIRVRYPPYDADLETSVEWALRAQELLIALRTFDADESIADALRSWQDTVLTTLTNLRAYLREHRHDARFDETTLRPIKRVFRDHYEYGREIKANFSDDFRTRLIKLLRDDDPETPLSFSAYEDLLETAMDVMEYRTPTKIDAIERRETDAGAIGTFDQLWVLLEAYAEFVEDENNLDSYERILRAEPWKECDCTICGEYGIEVAIWRGNNRNRRRGFHNTRRFYDQFQRDLPKSLVITRGSTALSQADTVEEYLREEHETLWTHIHDIPVAEVGVVTAHGVHEWWDSPPTTISFAPNQMADELSTICERYQDLYVDESDWTLPQEIRSAVEQTDCTVHVCDDPSELRSAVLSRLNYNESFLPKHLQQAGLTEF